MCSAHDGDHYSAIEPIRHACIAEYCLFASTVGFVRELFRPGRPAAAARRAAVVLPSRLSSPPASSGHYTENKARLRGARGENRAAALTISP